MSRYAWSEKDTFELIKLYETNAALWDTKHMNYRNREVKTKIVRNIAMRMNVTTEEINRKLHNLRNQLSQELNKLKKKKNANSSDEMPTSNWSYFSALKFLIPSVINRSRSSDNIIQRMLEEKESDQRSIMTRNRLNEGGNEKTSEKKCEERREKKHPAESSDVRYEEELRHSLRLLPKVPDENDRFGEYVALELRSLRSEASKRKLKSEIRKAICRIADLDDAGIFVPGTSSNSSPPPYSPQSPIYMSVCEITNLKSEKST